MVRLRIRRRVRRMRRGGGRGHEEEGGRGVRGVEMAGRKNVVIGAEARMWRRGRRG